jgi:hypothetical protein
VRRWQRLRLGKGDLHSHWFLSVSARPVSADVDVIEVTHGLAAAASKGLLKLSEPRAQLVRGAVSRH